MLKKIIMAASFAALLGQFAPAYSADLPKNPKKHVKSGLYVTAKEAYEMLQANPKAILVDVRDPIEVQFTGFTDEADIHVPFMISDRTLQHESKPIYAMNKNKNFAEEVEEALIDLEAGLDTPIFFMCRSGSGRSPKATNELFALGYKNVYTVIDGFEGGKNKMEGPQKGMRNVSGWRNSGLPWSYKLNFNKMYFAEK